nr:hypothetical protein OG409_24355 [Streptomyces sp. NBC_00974]
MSTALGGAGRQAVGAAALWFGAGGLLAAAAAPAGGGCAGDLVRTPPFSTGEARV